MIYKTYKANNPIAKREMARRQFINNTVIAGLVGLAIMMIGIING